MKIKIDLAERGRELAKIFENKSIKIEDEIEDRLFQIAQKIHTDAVKLAPVDTGQLRNSLSITQEGKSKDAVFYVGTLVEYATIHEYGGYAGRGKKVYIAPQPYLRPAIYQNKNFILSQLSEISEIIKKTR